MRRLTDKVAYITGGSEGIGRATAIQFAQEGAKVAISARSASALQDTLKEIEQYSEGLVIESDVADEDQTKDAYAAILKRWGRLDIVFANAGVNGVWAPIEELKLKEWEVTVNTNLTGTFLTIKHAIPMLRKNGGSIIITSSVNGTRIFSNTGSTAYSSTKAAQVAFGKRAALELASHNIRVNIICPGRIDTDIHAKTVKRNLDNVEPKVEYPDGKIPLTHNKPGTPEDVAELVTFLASDAAHHITGTEIWIDGAESLLIG